MNLYLEDQIKINTDDAMVFITDDDLTIINFSENVLTFIDITME